MLSKIQGCFMGVLLGDALGLPVEMMSREDILEKTNNSGIRGFADYALTWPLSEMQRIGMTSDDWQLTTAVARSLMDAKGWSRSSCVDAHIREYKKNVFGWGKTTRDALAFLSKNPKFCVSTHLPFQSGKGCGNGVAMKVSPIGLYHGMTSCRFDPALLARHCMELGAITHPDPRAGIAAFVVAYCVAHLLHEKVANRESGILLLETIIEFVVMLENIHKHLLVGQERLSERLSRIEGVLDEPDKIRMFLGTGCWALESIPFVIATFLRHSCDFRAGVLDAVNAGGDTDSNASMVGALIGTNCGVDSIPAEWRFFKERFSDALTLAEEFNTVFSPRQAS